MFEKLLEKILGRIIGEYVEGIQKNQIKVGILGGNVEIKNLTLKKNIIQQLNLPFDLKFGMIEHIKLKIPWTSIQSSPVVAYLKGLYILIVPKDQETWKDLERDAVQSKHQLLVQYAETLKDTITEKLKIQDDKNKDEGYFGKLVQKIIDNLQIDIKDIHIRLESSPKMDEMSFGLTLDSINIFTCDQNWEKKFLEDNRSTVYKKMNILNFFIYFNSQEKEFLHQKFTTQEQYLEEMRGMIYSDVNKNSSKVKNLEYLLDFSTSGKLIQNKLTKQAVEQKIPQYDLQISLDTTNFSLSKNQLKRIQQILNIGVDFAIFQAKNNRKFEYYGFRPTRMIADQNNQIIRQTTIKEYWKYAIKYAKGQVNSKDKKWLILSKRKKENLKEKFMSLYEKALKAGEISVLTKEEQRLYENVLMTMNNQVISKWIEEKVKQEKIEEQLNEEKKKKQGYFGWFRQSKDLDDDEKLQIEEYVQELIEAEQEQEVEVPEDYPKIKFTLVQNKFAINLQRKELFENKSEQVSVSTKELEVHFFMQQKGFLLDMSLNNFKIKYAKLNGTQEQFVQQILNCKEINGPQGDKFIQVRIEDSPKQYLGLNKKIDVQLGSINLVYNKEMVECISDIFTFDKVNDDLTDHLKSQAKQKIRQAQDITEQAMRNFIQDQPTYLISVKVNTPQIVLPVEQNQNIKKSASWVFHPGNLTIYGDNFTKKDDKLEQMYDDYSIGLQDISMMYCPNLLQLGLDSPQEADLSQCFSVFKEFNIQITCNVMKPVFVKLNLKETRTIINADLNALRMNFDSQIITKLKQIAGIFIDEGQRAAEKQRQNLLQNCQRRGYVYLNLKKVKNAYYAVLDKNWLYFFKNPQKDSNAEVSIDLETAEFEFQNGSSQINIKDIISKQEYLIEFDKSSKYEKWKVQIIKRLDHIKERKKNFQVAIEPESRKTNLTATSEGEQVEEVKEEEILNVSLNFKFDDLSVNIQSPQVNYLLNSSKMSLQLTQSTYILKTHIEFNNFTLQTEENGIKEFLITSNYEESLASKILRQNYIQEQQKLIIIEFEQGIGQKKSSQKANILFGSVFFDIEPSKLKNLMKVVMGGEQQITQSTTEIQNIAEDDLLNEKTLEIYDRSDSKINNPQYQSVDMEIILQIQAINVLIVNEIKLIPQNDMIIKNSSLKVLMRKGHMEVEALFNDIAVYDLTNYPNTISERNLDLIVPRKIFGILESNKQNTLVKAEFQTWDPLLTNISDDLANGKLNVHIQDISIDFHMQVVFRLLGFLTDQLLPCLNTGNAQPQEPGQVSKKQAFINIFKPFWQKMDILIENTQCSFQIADETKVVANLQKLVIKNNRTLNLNRLIQFGEPSQIQHLNKIKGIWEDEYALTFQELKCILVEKEKQQNLTTGLGLQMIVIMALFEPEYKLLFGAKKISNHEQRYMQTNIKDTSHEVIDKKLFYMDNSILVDMTFSSFILLIGNKEYCALMGVLEKCVSKNDGLEAIYIKDFQKKEAMKEPMSLYTKLKMGSIGLVSLDNKRDNIVYSKVFVEDLVIECAMFQSGQMAVQIGIKRLQGSHLLQSSGKYYEKGFIGDFGVRNVYEKLSNDDLRTEFIKELVEKRVSMGETIQDEKNCFYLLMEDDKERDITLKIQGLKILAQLDVLLHLSALTAMQTPQTPKIEEKKIEQYKAPQKQLVMNVSLEIVENCFLLTDSYFDNCLVSKGDLFIQVSLYPEKTNKDILNEDNFKTIQESIKLSSTRNIQSTRTIQSMKQIQQSQMEYDNIENKFMAVDLQMKGIQCFITKCLEIFEGNIDEVAKREIILPWQLDLNFEKFILYKASEEFVLPSKYNIIMLRGLINENIEMKIADDDMAILLSIMNHALVLMGGQKQEKKEEEKKEEENEIQEIKEIKEKELFVEKTYSFISFNVLGECVVTLVHQFNQIFVPNFIFKLKTIKIAADIKENIMALVAFGIQCDYFNSDNFKWEPFIESSHLKIEYETILDNGVVGKNIKIINPQKTLNINFSIPFLQKVLFLQNTSSELEKKRKEELKSLQQDSLAQNLENLQQESQIRKKSGKKQVEQRVFVSPVSVLNQTGYQMEITYYKKLVIITEENIPQMKNIQSKSVFLENNQSAPLNILDEQPINDEEEEKQENFTQTFQYKFFSFKILHPHIKLKKVSGLNLEQNFSKKIALEGDQKHVRHLSVLFNSKNENEMKQIKITSPILIQNQLDKNIQIKIRQADIMHDLEIPVGGEEFIKFDLLYFLTYFYIDGEEFQYKHKKLDHFVGKQNGYYYVMSNKGGKGKVYNFIMKLVRNEEFSYLTKIVLLPGLGFKNLLPVPLTLTLVNQMEERVVKLDKHQQFHCSDFDVSVKVSFRIKLPGFMHSQEFPLIENQALNYPKTIPIYDNKGNYSVFNIIRLKKENRHFDFAIYCDLILINETDLFYSYQSKGLKQKKFESVAGVEAIKGEEEEFNSRIAFVGSEKSEVQLHINNDQTFFADLTSTSILTQGIGSGVVHEPIKKRMDDSGAAFFLEVGYKNYMHSLDEEEYISSKILQLVPKTILYNKTTHNIKLINQSQLKENLLEPEEKQPLFIYDAINNKNKFLDIEIQIGTKKYKNAFPLDLNTAGSSLFALLDQSHEALLIRMETIIQDDYVVVNFLDRSQKEDLVLKNETQFKAMVFQKECRQLWTGQIPSKGKIECGFINPYKDQCFVFEFYSDKNILIHSYQVDLTQIKDQPEIKVIYGEKTFFNQKLILVNESRVIEVSTQNEEQRQLSEHLNSIQKKNKGKVQKTDFMNVRIDLNELGVSLISQFNNTIMEIFYLYINKATLVAIITEQQREIQFAINYVNIDNNYYSLSKYPVLLTPQTSLKQTKKTGEQFLNFHCIQNVSQSENLLSFDVIEFQLQPLVVTTEDILVQVLLSLGEQMQKVFNSKGAVTYIDKYFGRGEHTPQNEWEVLKFRGSQTWLYCKQLQIAQMQIVLSLGINQLSELKLNSNMNVNHLLKTFGIAFISVDETPLTFPNLEMFSLFESFEGFQNIMITHFKDTMRMNIAKIVGNLDIIGNPVSLFSNVAGGFKAVYQKPKEGFVKGPLEGVVGIGTGSATLLKATTTSAFKAVSKMSNSIASGLTSLAMDEKYLKERNLYRASKPQNIFEGVGKGVYSIGKGVFSGIKGVFTKPIDEMQKSGAHGFFKGMVKGLGGLITKPIGGVFDAVSLTAEGTKKTLTFFDDKANESKQRYPRVFYGDQRFIKKYNREDAQVMKALFFIEGKRFETDVFLDCIKLQQDEEKNFWYFVLTQEHLILLKNDMQKVVMFCEIKNVIRVIIDNREQLKIQYQQNNESQNFLINNSENRIAKILKSVNYARYLYYTKNSHRQ